MPVSSILPSWPKAKDSTKSSGQTPKEHKYVEEAGTMNLFFRIGDKLLTAPTSDRILDGVTRKSVITLAEDMGIEVEVRPIEVAEIVRAAKAGTLQEIFGSGTAAVIIRSLALGTKAKPSTYPN